MKLFRFEVCDMRNVPWLQQEYNDLMTIRSTEDTKKRMELFKQYASYIPNIEYMRGICVQILKATNDRELILTVLKYGHIIDKPPSLLNLLSDQFLGDKEIVMHAVSLSHMPDLYLASQELRNDKEVVMKAVERIPASLEFASGELRRDRDVCLTALTSNPDYLTDTSLDESLQCDSEFAWDCITKNGLSLMLFPDHFKSNREYVLAAVKNNGMALQYASTELRNDREIVSMAVNNCKHYSALRFASDEMKDDREIVTMAIQRVYPAFQYASIKLKDDLEFVNTLAHIDIQIIPYASDRLRNDKKFIMSLLRTLGTEVSSYKISAVVRSLSDVLRGDEEVMKLAVSLSGLALGYGSHEIRSNRDIVQIAVSKCSRALRYAIFS